MSSYSSISPSSDSDCASFRPHTNRPLPGSDFRRRTASPKSARTSSAFQSTRSIVRETTYFRLASIVRANGSIQGSIQSAHFPDRGRHTVTALAANGAWAQVSLRVLR